MPSFTLAYWRELLPHIPHWHLLTLPRRQAALALPNSYEPPAHAFRRLSPELEAALFETNAQGETRPAEPLRRLTAAVHRFEEWSQGPGVHIPRYVQAATTHAQRHAMTGIRIGANPQFATAAFAKRLQAGAFSRALAESDTPQSFLRAVGGWVPDSARFGPREHGALKDWLGQATRNGNATYVLDEGAFAGAGLPPAELLHLAVGYGVAIVFRRSDTLLPCFGAIAPAAASDQDPERIAYVAAPDAPGFARPFLLDDMEVWLRSLKEQPAPVLSDGWNVPAAHRRKIAKLLPALPAFLAGPGFAGEDRAWTALWMILKLELADATGKRRKDWGLGLSEAGEAWLASTRRERLAAVLGWAPLGARRARERETLSFLGETEDIPFRADTDTLYAWMRDAFVLPGTIEWRAFLDSAAEKANPLLADAEKDAELAGRWASWRTPPEDLYLRILSRYGAGLASLGALAFAPGPKGNSAVTLTPVGRWLYRKAEAWALPEPVRDSLIVGADFTVTPLLDDADARMDLAAFAEPEGRGFRITRAAVQAAAHRGRTADDLLAVLEARRKHALPANVVHEIKAWAGARKSVAISEAILVEGDDPLTLAEIRGAFPKDFVPVSPTALKYVGKGTKTALARKLAKQGFFA